jgi:flagellar biosynthetic protein FliP
VPPVPASGGVARADTMLTRLAPRVDLRVGETNGGLRLSGTVGVVVMMGLLTLLPTLLLMMTGFTRILIVLHFLKQALGTQSAPPAHLVSGLALLLTGFVMAPTLSEVNRTALQPWMDGRIEQAEMLSTGVKPFREFMLRQTRDRDIQAFIDMSAESDAAAGNPVVEPTTPDDVSLVVLVSAFVTSELRTAFQLGFALFLPFIVIDVVVSSVLMSMGMFMLPPAMIALPFKLLLFVLVDGWGLVVQSLVQSFK